MGNSSLIRELDAHLHEVWSVVLQDWKSAVVGQHECKAALVTRQCIACGTQVRLGAMLPAVTLHAPVGDRAYCATCKFVTTSPVTEVCELNIDEGQKSSEPD